VPSGYVSDTALSDTSTYDNASFSSLGATPGTYKWTWGSGANQNFTVVVGTVVPEPSTWAMMLIGFAGLGLIGYQGAGRQRRAARNA
jgi:PEP-CTERM motif